MSSPEEQARRARWLRRRAYQKAADGALTPESGIPATAVRAAWKPMQQFIQEGPDVGERQEPESEKGQRIN